MGKKNKLKQGNQTEHCPATVFVSNLPFSFTKDQLEESFSDVAPIRRCFMVSKKGSSEHRGIGFVQFATAEDANRAIEMKNNSSVGGRRVTVKHANHRAPLDQRRPKSDQAADSNVSTKTENETDSTPHAGESPDQSSSVPVSNVTSKSEIEMDSSPPHVVEKHAKSSKVPDTAKPLQPPKKAKKAKKLAVGPADEGKTSDKQRVARTVILGGLLNADMAQEVLRRAKEIDGVCSVTYPLPKEELGNHGLSQEGCRLEAASVLYASIRSARASVAALHQKQINGGSVWARQLGGEGSKTQKWKLIVRNLPFQAKVNEIREKFATAGFIWDVFIPQNSETRLSKGFAFVKFTSKFDAENAILKFNGQTFGKRTIAVDWAVPKKIYTTSAMASENGQPVDENADSDADEDSEDDDFDLQKKVEVSKDANLDPEDSDEDKVDLPAAVDFDEEVELARKVLQNVIAASVNEAPTSNERSNQAKDDADSAKAVSSLKKPTAASQLDTEGKDKNTKDKPAKSKSETYKDDLPRTIFINNLPFDLDPEELKQRFSSFGNVQSFVPVLHPVTKRPRGTGFLKFSTTDAVDAAVDAANSAIGLGIFFKGRQLKVLRALDKTSAQNLEVEKSKNENQDMRNLYLAKEGLILEGTPAAEGVSADDLAKRQWLHHKKMTKLQSPNFHVSKTRLIMYNLPKSMTPKELKNLCIDAVTSKASKQTPVIRQIKFLNNVKKGQVTNFSRGVAFVEFAEHQHAVVALSVLNNNPATFGPQHRPIVEFAIDNVQTLRKRDFKITDQLQKSVDGGADTEDNAPSLNNTNKEKFRKRKFEDGKAPETGGEVMRGNKEADGATAEGKLSNKRKKHDQTRQNKSRKPFADSNEQKKHDQRQNPRHSSQDNNVAGKPKHKKQVERELKKRKANQPLEEASGGKSVESRKRNKNKQPADRAVVDKLDTLIEQYKSKFSQKNAGKSADGKQEGSKQQIKKWL